MLSQFPLERTLKALLACTIMTSLVTSCTSLAQSSEPPAAASESDQAAEPMVISLEKGELLSIISVIPNKGEAADAARTQYYQTAFPLAQQYGLKREGQLRVVATPVGGHESEGIIFFSWPNKAAEAKLEAEPAWPGIKALRPQAWDDLRVFTDELDQDLTLTFSPDKTYTLAMAWINPENPDDYDVYMDGIKEAVDEVGGRFIYKMFDPKFESHKLKDGAPGQVTLVEWDSPQGLASFGETEGFKENAKYLTSGVTRFEILALSAR